MNRISVNISDELNEFFKNLAKKNDKSVSKICSEVLENFRNERLDFESKIQNELSSNSIEMKKLTLKIQELEKNIAASLILNRQILNESSTSSYFFKHQYNEFYKQNPKEKETILDGLKKYNDERDGLFKETLKKISHS